MNNSVSLLHEFDPRIIAIVSSFCRIVDEFDMEWRNSRWSRRKLLANISDKLPRFTGGVCSCGHSVRWFGTDVLKPSSFLIGLLRSSTPASWWWMSCLTLSGIGISTTGVAVLSSSSSSSILSTSMTSSSILSIFVKESDLVVTGNDSLISTFTSNLVAVTGDGEFSCGSTVTLSHFDVLG